MKKKKTPKKEAMPEFEFKQYTPEEDRIYTEAVTKYRRYRHGEAIALGIGGNMCLNQPGLLTAFHFYVSFRQAYLSGPYRLDLGTLQDQPGLESLQQEVFEICFAIGRNDFNVFSHA